MLCEQKLNELLGFVAVSLIKLTAVCVGSLSSRSWQSGQELQKPLRCNSNIFKNVKKSSCLLFELKKIKHFQLYKSFHQLLEVFSSTDMISAESNYNKDHKEERSSCLVKPPSKSARMSNHECGHVSRLWQEVIYDFMWLSSMHFNEKKNKNNQSQWNF